MKKILALLLASLLLIGLFAGCAKQETAPVQQEQANQKQQDDLVGKEDQSRFAYLRQMNALRMEMKKAVHQENFERAAELRDQIHALEAEYKKESE